MVKPYSISFQVPLTQQCTSCVNFLKGPCFPAKMAIQKLEEITLESSVMLSPVTSPIPADAQLVLARDTKSRTYTISLKFSSSQSMFLIEDFGFGLEEESRAIEAFNLYAKAVKNDNAKFSYNPETRLLDCFIQVDSRYLRLIRDNLSDL